MKRITLKDRIMLADYLKIGYSYREIARRMGRGHSSISDEIRLKGFTRFNYDPNKAHEIHIERRINRKKRTKLEISPGLKKFINDKIKSDWSPEQVSGVLREMGNGKTVISHESIYQYIYSDEGKKSELYEHLRHKKRPRRQKNKSRKHRGVTIKERVSISERPEVVNERAEFGHWEVDLIIFSSSKQVLAVCIERISRCCRLFLLPNKTAAEMKEALTALKGDNILYVKSITFDNGTENANHHELKKEWEDLKTYFCAPYCSWQKGAVENLNGLIRQYLPRKVDPNKLTQGRILIIQDKLNRRPRKILEFKTPEEIFAKYTFL